MKGRFAFLAASLAWPAACYATESSSLFVLLFGVPSFLLAVVFAAVSLKAPRGGAVLCGMLLASVVPIYFWAMAQWATWQPQASGSSCRSRLPRSGSSSRSSN